MTDSIIHTALTGRRAVILDWDGTLVDTQDRNYQALSAALAPHHATIDRDWYRHHAPADTTIPAHDAPATLT